jgi:ADP-dependent NAD(P)H-hydrate dehydratase / NAD(P)H-hydrate epimerase
MKILSAMQMAEVDRLTTERYSIPSILLMDNAGRSVAEEIEKACPGFDRLKIAVFCGRGNNGGDGFVAARYLALRGANPLILLFSEPEKLKGDARTHWEIAQAMGLQTRILTTPAEAKSYLKRMDNPDIIVDALFGTGLTKPIGADFRHVVEWMNRRCSKAFVAAVDIPSGLMADSSEIIGPAVKAHLTVTFSALKLAHVLPPASDFAGDVALVPIGSPPALLDNPSYRLNLVDELQIRKTLPRRARDSHKGSFGHVYVMAGSRGKSGAALMTGIAALRSGAGLVTLWLPKSLQKSVVGKFPELMTEVMPETEDGTSDQSGAGRLLKLLPDIEALVVGPGVTTHPSTQRLVWELVRRSPVPVILDADGINAFIPPAKPPQNENNQPVILTPHPGEMARLLVRKISAVQENRLGMASEYAAKQRCYLVLKGFQTVIATPEGDAYISTSGNPGMATGGTGDILAGMMGRFVAGWKIQNSRGGQANLADYICAAVFLHGIAGDLAAEEKGMESLIATDLLEFLPAAFKRVTAP